MFSSSLFTLILVSLQRGLAPIFYNISTYSLYQIILKTLGKTVKIINKCIFKCISVFYTFSTRLLKTQCNMWNKVIQMPVEMWKNIDRNPLLILVEKHHFCSDVREQSITLSPLNVKTFLNIYIPLFLFPQYNFVYTHTCGKLTQTRTSLGSVKYTKPVQDYTH